MTTTYIIIAFIAGALLAWIFQQLRIGSRLKITQENLQSVESQFLVAQSTLAQEKEINQQQAIEVSTSQQKIEILAQNLNETLSQIEKERQINKNQSSELAKSQTTLEYLTKQMEVQKREVENLQEKFKVEFENIANKLLEEKSQKFTTQNQEKLNEIIKPLGEKIKDFEQKVENTNKESIERNVALRQEIIGLKELNKVMSKEAINLTKALKGDSKIQGNWGEVVLERILEKSALQKDREYKVQESLTDVEGKRFQPDVVIYLPNKRHLIIDSKVSLVAYERYASEDDDNQKEVLLKQHLLSIKAHIKQLSDKQYQYLEDINSLDFVLMFIPVEPALNLALFHDDSLYQMALEKNIVLVSQTTLLATLRTINSIWKSEYQTRNVQQIAKEAGKMYDKFVTFLDDLKKVGDQMDRAKNAYSGAMNKLVDGSGNLIRRAEKIKKLGAKSVKQIPNSYVSRASELPQDEQNIESLDKAT